MQDKQSVSIENFTNELDKVFVDFIHQSFETRQDALQAGAEVAKTALENATPRGETGGMARSWGIKTKYKDRRYVGNSKTVNGKGKDGRYREGIPLSNVIEYKDNGKHAFIRNTFDGAQGQIFDAIKNKLNGGK